jgi:hypothetical protein
MISKITQRMDGPLRDEMRRLGIATGRYTYEQAAETYILETFGYFECISTPGLWYHEVRPITYTLAVDDFGGKYVNKSDVNHLIASIKTMYTLSKDWTGDLNCGIKLGWDYGNQTVDISMPGYIQKNTRI